MQPLFIQNYTLVNALGQGRMATLEALREGRSGLRSCYLADADLTTWIGQVDAIDNVSMPDSLSIFDCRNNRLALLGLNQDGFGDAVRRARHRFGENRIGVFIGTTTSGIGETEQAYRQRDPATGALPANYRYQYTHNTFSAADFVRRFLDLKGPAQAVLTSCSSSAKVFGVAYRFMQAGLCDAAVVGGVDSLCLTTLLGFNALQLLSDKPCCPWDRQRKGISIGEAAGFALLVPAALATTGLAMVGYGESQDAYHLSAPHPQGTGAILAMERALACAQLSMNEIDYINLHGTATVANDTLEDRAVITVFGQSTLCSATKGWTGHTLGAAGITEAVFCCLALEHGFIPASVNTENIDANLKANLQLQTMERRLNYAMSNAFGFGGSNCTLVFGITA